MRIAYLINKIASDKKRRSYSLEFGINVHISGIIVKYYPILTQKENWVTIKLLRLLTSMP